MDMIDKTGESPSVADIDAAILAVGSALLKPLTSCSPALFVDCRMSCGA